MHVVECRPRDLVAAVDQVFGAERHRTGSVAERWPEVFADDSAGRGFAIRDGGHWISGLVAQPFQWIDQGVERQAHAVGSVFTLAAARGGGLASTVLRNVAERVTGPMVLWTGHPEFYARHGWQNTDDGTLLAEWQGIPSETGLGATPLDQADRAQLEHIRAAWAPCRIIRSAAAWRALPFGADRMLVASTEHAYVLFGQAEGRTTVYEMLGDPDDFAVLWSAVTAGCGRVMVNLSQAVAASRWLTRTHGLAFQPKVLSCWYRWPAEQRWAFPWFDRI